MYEMGKAEVKAAERVINSHTFFRYGGKEVAACEKEIAAILGNRYAITVTSGTSALIVALKAMGVGPGHSVLVPGYTFVATALAVVAVGAIPIYTEVDESLTICPEDILKKARRHTTTVIPVHMQGMPCNMKAVKKAAAAKGLNILEDCAQAFGGMYGKKHLGTIGQAGAYSFNQYKIIACGEGGAVTTNNKKLAERMFMAQDGSCSVWDETEEMSQDFFCSDNARFNELGAAILRVQLKRLEGILKELRQNRQEIVKALRLPAGLRWIPSHDENGQCGSSFILQAESVALAEKTEQLLVKHLSAHRPINSARHIYSDWSTVNARAGGHHPAVDPFQRQENRKIKTNYDKAMKKTDQLLASSVLCHTPFKIGKSKLRKLIKEINAGFQSM